MRESVKLLICVLCGALVASVIGMVVIHISSYFDFQEQLPNMLTQPKIEELSQKTEQMKEDFLNSKNNGEDLVAKDYILANELTSSYSSVMYVLYSYYTFLTIGVIIGAICYLIFVKKSKAKKLVLPTIIGIVVIAVIGTFLWKWDIFDVSSYSRQEFGIVVCIFAICVVIAYIINMLIQKHKVKKLNDILKSNK